MRRSVMPAAFATLAVAVACRRPPPPAVVRLVDVFNPEAVQNAVKLDGAPAPRAQWRFGEPAADVADKLRPTHGWQAGPGVTDLAIREGRLAGRTTTAFPIVYVTRTSVGDADLLHAIEVRVRVSAGTRLQLSVSNDEKPNLAEAERNAKDDPESESTPIVAGSETRTYSFKLPGVKVASEIRNVFLRPTDVAGATFAIESLRLVLRKEHLAGIPSGVSWQGLGGIFEETLVARSPESIRMAVTLPERPWLDLAVGTVEDGPVGFKVEIAPAGASSRDAITAERTLTTPHRWEDVSLDLARFGSRPVTLTLSVQSERRGAIGFWGGPVLRSRSALPKAEAAVAGERAGDPPQGVIVIWADTLRPDHLDVYGYERPTAPTLRDIARHGTLFRNCLVQATWTKVSTPSLMTSLYPTSHAVATWDDRVAASATTMAEVYRAAGYATFSYASNFFTGMLTNLHQGFEEVHEAASLPDRRNSKTARIGMDRLFPWLEAHRDGPFFVFMSVLDPHDPYKPYPPYDTLWANPAKEKEHVRQTDEARKHITNPFLKMFGMPNRKQMLAAKIDPEAYIAHVRDWYDGSIRGLDAEIARLLERLRALGLDQRTLVVFTADHGEEFLEHGAMFHGQSTYGELNRVPLILWGPAFVPAGGEVAQVVETIDLMPTLLALSRLHAPGGMQGRSLLPLLASVGSGTAEAGTVRAAGRDAAAWIERPAITEKLRARDDKPPDDNEAVAIVAGGFKLVHNTHRYPPTPEIELFDFGKDPLDTRNIADEHPEVVRRLKQALDAWRKQAQAARLRPDAESTQAMSAEELERLRALGYVQ